jgi:N-acetylneuraminic acid mutarotase
LGGLVKPSSNFSTHLRVIFMTRGFAIPGLLLPQVLLVVGLLGAAHADAASWTTNSPLADPRYDHTATLLPDGKVLVVGGEGIFGPRLTNAVLFDPAAGQWTVTGSLSEPREQHAAVLLRDGTVMVVGGANVDSGILSSAEIYNPRTGTWMPTGSMKSQREFPEAVLLPNGKVLVAGGTTLLTTELYDPISGTWTNTGSMSDARRDHTLTLLPNGKVLAAGGSSNSVFHISSADLYDPATGTWTPTGALNYGRTAHTATLLPNGKVLVAGGATNGTLAELYDPATGKWTVTNPMTYARALHRATLLPNGTVLVEGGGDGVRTNSAEIYDPATGLWSTTASLNVARDYHTATLLANGTVLVVGGRGTNFNNPLSSTEVFDYATGTWTNGGSMTTGRYGCNATLMPNEKVLVAGGINGADLSSADLYDPSTGIWTPTTAMNSAGFLRTMTVLPNGKVLVTGGENSISGALSGVEVYDPSLGTWTANSPLSSIRLAHTATLLPNGNVLLAGGSTNLANNNSLSITELYEPATGTRTLSGSLNTARRYHTATLLKNGRILVAGGFIDGPTNTSTNNAELYDPATGSWTNTGSMMVGRAFHTATLLPNGNVLVAGGVDETNSLSSVELYDPVTQTWTTNGVSKMSIGRRWHAAILLSNGKVAVFGGSTNTSSGSTLSSIELFDPATGTWSTGAAMSAARRRETATLLPDGRVLVTGAPTYLSSTEIYDVGLGSSNSWRPQIASATSPIALGTNLSLSGSKFRGLSGGSGGAFQDSPADYPLVQLRSIENNLTTFLLCTNWATNSFTSVPVWNFPPGWTLATVFVNGIQSTSAVINITVPVPSAPMLASPTKLSNGAFQFTFTNSVGAIFGAFTTTNLSTPSNWTALGAVAEVVPGQFLFIDSRTTNDPQRFYRVRSP